MTRTVVTLLIALLITTTLGGVIFWWVHTTARQGITTTPLLSQQQLSRLPYFKEPCTRREDCKLPLECVNDPRVDGFRCLGQECWTDAHCEPGQLCRTVPASGGTNVRLCLVEGTKGEGELCDEFPLKGRYGCRPGLFCNSWYCGRSCRLGEPSSCPRGQTCRAAPDGASCVPSCLQTGCPSGKRCVPLSGEFSICATLVGTDCEKNPCPAGQMCVTSIDRQEPGVVRLSCQQPCNEHALCPTGSICFNGYCQRSCDPQQPDACGPEQRCNLSRPLPPVWICEHR